MAADSLYRGGMGELSPRIRFELQDAYGKDFEIEIDLEYDPYQKSFLGIKLENDQDGRHVYITRLNPKKLFYQKLLELEATLPAGAKMMTPFKVKSLTIMEGSQKIFEASGPAQEMLSALRSLVPTPTSSAVGTDFVTLPPAATDGLL
jgi:hypothetical protein